MHSSLHSVSLATHVQSLWAACGKLPSGWIGSRSIGTAYLCLTGMGDSAEGRRLTEVLSAAAIPTKTNCIFLSGSSCRMHVSQLTLSLHMHPTELLKGALLARRKQDNTVVASEVDKAIRLARCSQTSSNVSATVPHHSDGVSTVNTALAAPLGRDAERCNSR